MKNYCFFLDAKLSYILKLSSTNIYLSLLMYRVHTVLDYKRDTKMNEADYS